MHEYVLSSTCLMYSVSLTNEAVLFMDRRYHVPYHIS